MFINFLYELKKTGIPVSLVEWMTLMEALSKGLAYSNLSEFYYLARTILVKSETQFDNYDLAFHNYFNGIESPTNWVDDVLEWLREGVSPQILVDEQALSDIDEEHTQREFAEKENGSAPKNQEITNAVSKDGGMYFGRNGFNPKGSRIGGIPGNFSAIQVAARRDYKGYRSDVILGVRKYEVALRVLRELTNQHEGRQDELDIDATIDTTCRNAGRLELVWTRPRKNNLRIVLIMDSGGSMDMHINLCSQLFSAFKRSSHLKELKIYYFHNCIYDNLYTKPACIEENAIATYDILRNLSDDYRLIIIGDASMAESELIEVNGAIDWDNRNREPGLVWVERLARHFTHAVWLNPLPANSWDEKFNYRARSINMIHKLIPMFELSVSGLEKAVKQLKVSN